MVNDRLDVALAAKAHGVHLGTRSMPVDLVRRLAPRDFVVGASCHSLEEALAARSGGRGLHPAGADFRNALEASVWPAAGTRQAARSDFAGFDPGFRAGRNHHRPRRPLPPERRGGNRRNPDLSGLRFGGRIGSRFARRGTAITCSTSPLGDPPAETDGREAADPGGTLVIPPLTHVDRQSPTAKQPIYLNQQSAR